MVDKEDLYMLKINCKGRRIVGKANKGINVEKNNRFKKLKLEKEENSTELQKSNIEAEVSDNSKKYDWGIKKKKVQKVNWIS